MYGQYQVVSKGILLVDIRLVEQVVDVTTEGKSLITDVETVGHTGIN